MGHVDSPLTTHQVVENMIDAASSYARSLYVQARRQFDESRTGVPSDWGLRPIPKFDGSNGEDDPHGRSFKPIWPRLVAAAAQADIPLERLISHRFATATGPRPPEPIDCIKAAVQVDAKRLLVDRAASLRGALQSDRANEDIEIGKRLLVSRKMGYEVNQTLIDQARYACAGDGALLVTPIYRFHLLVSTGQPELAMRFLSPAVAQYMDDPDAYDRAWVGFLHPLIPNTAAQVKAAYLRGAQA